MNPVLIANLMFYTVWGVAGINIAVYSLTGDWSSMFTFWAPMLIAAYMIQYTKRRFK